MLTRRVRTHVSQATQFTANRPSWAAGLRAAIATVVPIVAGASLGWHEALWMGLAGFNVVLSDKGGTPRMRLAAMLPSTIYGAVAAVTGAFAARHAWTAVVGIMIWSLAAGLARTYGAIATTTGIVSVATYIVSVSSPAATAQAAFARGGGILAGSAFAILIALLLWPMRPYRRVRRAVAHAYRSVAGSTGDDPRAAIDAARMALADLRRGLNGETARGERLLVLVESADRMSAAASRDGTVLEVIARAVEEKGHEALPDPDRFQGPMRDALVAVRELNGEEVRTIRRESFALRYVDPIRQNLVWSSVVLRHALRVAIAAGFAQALTYPFHIARGYWLTLSVIIILQPYTSATFQKGLQRAIGTIAGGLLAALLITLVHSPLQMTAVIFVGAALTVALLPVNYGLYSLCLTPTFVLLAELNAIDRHLVWLRVNNTLLGAAIAYAAAWILWPASERGRVREDLAAALRALADYTRCVGECDDAQAFDTRRAAIVAIQNGDTSLQRLLGDSASREDAESLMSILIYARRYGLAVSALAANTADRLRLEPLMRYGHDVLIDLAAAVDGHRLPPELPVDTAARQVDGADRLLDALIALHRSVGRLSAASVSS